MDVKQLHGCLNANFHSAVKATPNICILFSRSSGNELDDAEPGAFYSAEDANTCKQIISFSFNVEAKQCFMCYFKREIWALSCALDSK